jgi:hypothetical protein
MIRRPVLIVCCILLLAAGSITATSRNRPLSNRQNPPPTAPVPKHVITWLMLRQVVTLNKKAEEAKKQGKDDSKFRFRYKNLAGLSDAQTEILNRIAADCYAQVAVQDKKAKRVIDTFRAQVPGGKLADGQTPPPLPAELKEMQKERDRIVTEAYDRLRAAFGADEFTRFDKFVKEKFAPHVRNMTPSAVRPGFRPATVPRRLNKQQ